MFYFILFILLLALLIFSIINLSINGPKGYRPKEKIEEQHKSSFQKIGHSYLDKENNVAYTDFKIAGVTFKDGRASRQTALRMLKFQDPPMQDPIDFEFEDYEYDGKPAILIKANGRILGNVPADYVDEFIELRDKSLSMDLGYKVSGGGDYPFGCKMVITWRF